MNGQSPATQNPALLAVLALVAAAVVIAVLLVGDSWTRWLYYGVLVVGLLAATGSLGALVKVLTNRDS
ncbi:hypothetical protein ABZ281_35875 [Streptomyces sp. NPDC006265]|uniref:hypothetical protein n=1 Tax=Streptomyces sp. NPDC006265 TaxID=3156740 RepID=UPI0033B8E616